MNVLDVISAGCLFVGCSFALIGGVGLLRLPNFYTRIHGAGITDTMGAGLVLTGLMFQAPDWLVLVKLIAVLFFLLVTSPTSAHALAKSALSHGLEPHVADGEDRSSKN
jgi:multicomponent Na+:H+ antiporter subunit G